jgi:cytochrome c556
MKSVIACLLALGIAGNALAHDGATGVVRERMESMKVMERAMKAIVGMLKGKAPYSVARTRELARVISLHSGAGMTDLFPAGSIQHASEASPEIWNEPDRFRKLANELKARTKTLAAAAKPENTGPVAAALKQVAATCASCHKAYRVRK